MQELSGAGQSVGHLEDSGGGAGAVAMGEVSDLGGLRARLRCTGGLGGAALRTLGCTSGFAVGWGLHRQEEGDGGGVWSDAGS
ncbi:hypothetical protein ACPCTO_36600 [Streptomyces olivoreticuli]